MSRAAFALVALVGSSLCLRADPTPLTDAEFNKLRARVQETLDALRAKAEFPGVAVGVALADGRVAAAASGFADAEAKVPLRPTDRFLAGSVGKTFVAAVLLQLAEEGKVRLDDRLAAWLGAEPWFARLPTPPT